MSNQKTFLTKVLSGPLSFALVFFIAHLFCDYKPAVALATVVWMGIWWILRPVNIAVTALLPIPINAIFNLVPMDGIISKYFSEIVVLLFGSDLICLTWETTHLDKRMAIRTLCCVGPSMRQQILVWLAASTVLSIFLPNVVVVQILIPVAISMLKFLGEKEIFSSKTAVPILLAIVWGAGIGGFGSPLGGSANLVAIGYLEEILGHEFMYADWVLRFAPLLLFIMLLNLFFLYRIPVPAKNLAGGKEYFVRTYNELGKMSRGEWIGLILFVVAMVLAFIRPLYAAQLPLMKPAYVFFFFGMLTFFLKDEKGNVMLTWAQAEKCVGWGMLFLFAGGLALGKLITGTGADKVIANVITTLPLTGGIETILVFVIFVTILTEISSNTAAAAISIPVVLSTTQHLGVNAMPYLLISIVAFNCAYILPVSIRAIGVNYGLDPNALLKNGVMLSVAGMVLISIIGYILMMYVPAFYTL